MNVLRRLFRPRHNLAHEHSDSLYHIGGKKCRVYSISVTECYRCGKHFAGLEIYFAQRERCAA